VVTAGQEAAAVHEAFAGCDRRRRDSPRDPREPGHVTRRHGLFDEQRVERGEQRRTEMAYSGQVRSWKSTMTSTPEPTASRTSASTASAWR